MAVADNIATAISAFWPKRLPAAEPGREMRRKKRCKIRRSNRTRMTAMHRTIKLGKRKTPRLAGLFARLRQGTMTLSNT
ncbi:MAG: hypothetical protein IT446_00740 [Phycisphaerales bacterium]|nr:hypothetical protein [Phycisphaerales bacterium]